MAIQQPADRVAVRPWLDAPLPRPATRDHERELAWGSPRKRYVARLLAIRHLTEQLERELPLRDGRATYEARVSFEDALEEPLHRWYFYKEGFSPRLLGLLLQDLTPPRGWLLDSFGGVGTSALSCLALAAPAFEGAVSLEYNPFSHAVATTKYRARALDPARLTRLGKSVAAHEPKRLPSIPLSATLRNADIYPPHRLRQLRRIDASIDELAQGVYRDALKLALASVLEPASYARKDGRALRILPRDQRLVPVAKLFHQAITNMADDLRAIADAPIARSAVPARFLRGDARQLPKEIKAGSVGLALFSPPYLNGIDYSEVYKVEEYFFGFVNSPTELRRLREGTLRSHQSIQFPKRAALLPELEADHPVRALLAAISAFVEAEEDRAFQRQQVWLLPAYFDDMYRVLKEHARVLKPGGYSVCVVANSMIADNMTRLFNGVETRHELWRIPVATDAIIAALGREAGLETAPSIWARSLRPRNVRAGWSRETLVVMRKPLDKDRGSSVKRSS